VIWEFLLFIYRYLFQGANIGDLKDRFAIIDRLQCKSFKWFLDNVYPHKYVMDDQEPATSNLLPANIVGSILSF
jgi:hypothetical protein